MHGFEPDFSWITPDLAVGGSFPGGAAISLVVDHGIDAVIDVREEACDDAEEMAACGLKFLHLPTEDLIGLSQPMLDAGVAFAREAEAQRLRLLVHCQHGIGRSATLALCVLVDRGFAPMEALSSAKRARSLLSPSRSQYEAWAGWIRRQGQGADVPSYHEFGRIAYRHLPQRV